MPAAASREALDLKVLYPFGEQAVNIQAVKNTQSLSPFALQIAGHSPHGGQLW